jgi:DNA-binding CsgD family transcriptional regulator
MMMQAIDLSGIAAAALADCLDTLASGMFLVDAIGRIIHANASGHMMVAQANVVRAANGKLRAIDRRADQALHHSFTACCSGSIRAQAAARAGLGSDPQGTPGGGPYRLRLPHAREVPAARGASTQEHAPRGVSRPCANDNGTGAGRKGIAVPLTAEDGARYVAHVLPLAAGSRRRAGSPYDAVATVFVHKAALDLPPPPAALAAEFGLTPAELRVLSTIVEVGGVPEAAEATGLSEATVKTHLHRLFAKTGTRRQADLVKLVAAYSNALIG